MTSHLRDLTTAAKAFSEVTDRASTIRQFMECSIATGEHVQLLPAMGYMPALIGSDNEPVFLYQLIEMLEGYLDIDSLLEEFPTLNFSQIAGALSFIRKIAQINSRLVDPDELEEQFDAEFMNDLRQAFEERGNVARVLTHAD